MEIKLNTKIIFMLLILFSISFVSFSQDADIEKSRRHYRLGEIYYEHGLYEEAEAEFKLALELAGEDSQILAKQPVVKDDKPIGNEQIERPVSTQSQQQPGQYLIGVGDVLFVSVWENPDLTLEVIVRPDGNLSFPLIGEVAANSLSIPELDQMMTEKLKEYIRYPDVSISLRKIGGGKIIVLGEVKNPGVYKLDEKKSALEIIALAGGFTNHAVTKSVIVVEGGLEKPQPRRINLASAMQGTYNQDMIVTSNNIIYVPKKFIADLNYYVNMILDPLYKGAYTSRTIQDIQ